MGIYTDRKQMAILVKHFGPVVTMQNADAAGVSRGILRRLTERGDIQRLAKAAFTSTDTLEAASDWERFRLRSIAFALGSQEGTYLTGESGAMLLGLPVLGSPPELPTAIRHGSPHIGHNLSAHGKVRHGYLLWPTAPPARGYRWSAPRSARSISPAISDRGRVWSPPTRPCISAPSAR